MKYHWRMKKYKILVFTDHSKHSKENSIYALVTALAKHEQCQEVFVASRGNPQNDSFFGKMEIASVFAKHIQSTFNFDSTGEQFLKELVEVNIADFDVIFLRLPRPISDDFFHYLLEIAGDKIFVNHPKGIMETSSKAFLLNIPHVCPPMKLCKSAIDVFQFANRFPIVLKPLKEYGGKGIVKIINHQVQDGSTTLPLKEYLVTIKSELEREGFLAMKFLKNVQQGDKRILVVNGQILASSLRLPAEGSWLCNIAQGGTSIPSTVTDKEIQIIKEISPKLSEKGIVFFGADTLVDDQNERVLSEINTLSIGGFPQTEIQTGMPIVQMAIDNMINYINTQYNYGRT